MITAAYAKKHRTGNFGSMSSSGQSKSSGDQSTTKKGHKNKGSGGSSSGNDGGATTPHTIIPTPPPPTPQVTNCPDGSAPPVDGKCPPATPSTTPSHPLQTQCPDRSVPDANGKCPTAPSIIPRVDCKTNPDDTSCNPPQPETPPANITGGEGVSGNSGTGGRGTMMMPTDGSNITSPVAENRTRDNVTSSLPRNVSKTLSLSIHVIHDPIVRGNKQTIQFDVSTKNPSKKIEGASIEGAVSYVTTHKESMSGKTDTNGQYLKSWQICGDSNPGIFKVQAKASKNGYISTSGEASFKVICDILSRGCPSLPCNQTTDCHISLSISVAKNPITCRNVQIITVTVFDKDSHKPINAANVKVVVMTGLSRTNQFSGSTRNTLKNLQICLQTVQYMSQVHRCTKIL